MASKFIVVAVLLVQTAFGQYIAPGSFVTGNSVVENDIYVSGGGSASAYGLGSAGYGLGSAGYGLGSSALGVGSASLGLGNRIGVSGLGLAGSQIGTISSGSIGLSGLNVATGGPLLVTAISPIGPSGLAVASENAIEGNLLVTGQLPFLSAVAFEGALPTAGSGVATCGCGSGTVGITSEGFGRPGIYY